MSANDSLTIGWSVAEAGRHRRRFRRLLAVDLALTVLAGLVALIAPAWGADILRLPSFQAEDWIRLAGALAILAAVLQRPLYVEPTQARLLGLVVLPARLVFALLFLLLGGGFLWLAAYAALMGVLLLFTWRAYAIAELMTRP